MKHVVMIRTQAQYMLMDHDGVAVPRPDKPNIGQSAMVDMDMVHKAQDPRALFIHTMSQLGDRLWEAMQQTWEKPTAAEPATMTNDPKEVKP